jgi:hypothetical protein
MISCADSVEILTRAKDAGLPVSCGVSINNLTLNENDIGDYRTFLKLSPPLRHEHDRQATIDALASGLIDVIVSDHNPQDVETKRLPFAEAANGALGLETLLSAALRLVHEERITLPRLLRTSLDPPGRDPRAPGRTPPARRSGRPHRPRPGRALRPRQAELALAVEELALRRGAPRRARAQDDGGGTRRPRLRIPHV